MTTPEAAMVISIMALALSAASALAMLNDRWKK
jgi:hypothetical protein